MDLRTGEIVPAPDITDEEAEAAKHSALMMALTDEHAATLRAMPPERRKRIASNVRKRRVKQKRRNRRRNKIARASRKA